jgi:hypothetical protein
MREGKDSEDKMQRRRNTLLHRLKATTPSAVPISGTWADCYRDFNGKLVLWYGVPCGDKMSHGLITERECDL